jgi:hypothetical protein
MWWTVARPTAQAGGPHRCARLGRGIAVDKRVGGATRQWRVTDPLRDDVEDGLRLVVMRAAGED